MTNIEKYRKKTRKLTYCKIKLTTYRDTFP